MRDRWYYGIPVVSAVAILGLILLSTNRPQGSPSSVAPAELPTFRDPTATMPLRAVADCYPSRGEASTDRPLTVKFWSRSRFAPGVIVRYRWDFDGDGIFDQLPDEGQDWAAVTNTYEHKFEAPGQYDAVLQLTSDAGQVSTDACTIEVLAPGSLPTEHRASDFVDLDIPTRTVGLSGGSLRATINTDVKLAALVRILIKDEDGRVVRRLVNQRRTIGYYSDIWDGHDDNGGLVSHGTYFAVVQIPDGSSVYELDLTKSTCRVRYTPNREFSPQVFRPLDDEHLQILFEIPDDKGPSEVLVFVGMNPVTPRPGAPEDARFRTLVDGRVFGVGSHTAYWDGLDANRKYRGIAQGAQLLCGVYGFTLPANAIFIDMAPKISNVSVTPNFFDPATRNFISKQDPVAEVEFDVDKPSDIHLTVVNIKTGKMLKSITRRNEPAGVRRTVQWDGRAESGRFADKGDYRLSLEAVDSQGGRSVIRYAMVRVYY